MYVQKWPLNAAQHPAHSLRAPSQQSGDCEGCDRVAHSALPRPGPRVRVRTLAVLLGINVRSNSYG